jgi:hypothetical protein
MRTRTAGPTLADARQRFIPCRICCCDAASAQPPARLRNNLYNWEHHGKPDNIAKLAKLGVNKGVLNKIMLMMCHHNHRFMEGN